MNNTVLDKFNINRCDSEIVLISPINGEEIELTNPVILEFINGYKRGLSSEYAFKGDNYEPKRLRLEWESPVKATVWTVCLAYNTNFEDGYTFHTTEQFLEIDVHFTSKEIYWKVIADDGQLESNVARFTLNRLPENLFIEVI